MLAAVDPTTSYAAAGTSSHMKCAGADLISLLFTRVHGTATSIEWKVEWSYNASTWFRSTSSSTSAGTVTVTQNEATVAVSASVLTFVDTFPVQAPYVRVWVKRTGGSSTDTVAVVGLLRIP